MTRPNDVSAEAWDAARVTQREMFGNRADCITDYMFDQNTETIARAIDAATKAERERCLEAVAYVKENIITSVPGRSRFSEYDLNHTFKDACRIVGERIDGSWDSHWQPALPPINEAQSD